MNKSFSLTKILILFIIGLIAYNLYIFFKGTYAEIIVGELFGSEKTTPIMIAYNEIFDQTQGLAGQLIEYFELNQASDTLLYEKLSIGALFIGCAFCGIGIFTLPKRKYNLLIFGIVLIFAASGGLMLIVNSIESRFNSTTDSYGFIGALIGDTITFHSDTSQHFIINVLFIVPTAFLIYQLTHQPKKGEN